MSSSRLLNPFRLLLVAGILTQTLAGQTGAGTPQPNRPYTSIPKGAITKSDALIVAQGGQATFSNYGLGISGLPFLQDVYKSFGLSADARYYLYLKAANGQPTFSLFLHDLSTGAEQKVTDAFVHHAAWAPTGTQLGYQWIDATNQVHVSVYDVASGVSTEIASGRLQMEFLEWSPDAGELLYLTVEPMNSRAFETRQYTSSLHRHFLRQGVERVFPGVQWAQFDKAQLVVAGQSGVAGIVSIPNPNREIIRRFVIRGNQTYASILENSVESVKRWNPAAGSYEYVTAGRLIDANERGLVVQEIGPAGVGLKYIFNQAVLALSPARASTAAPSSSKSAGKAASVDASPAAAGTNWKLPYHGLASLVQGGQGFQNGACDGVVCFITAHVQELAYALDFQQMPENNQGNIHMLAVESGTVALITNNVTCSSNSACVSSWDTYKNPCNDPNDGAGNIVSIAHIDGTYSIYAHLKSGSVQVVPGQAVSQGTYLADQGHSGVAAAYNNYHVCGDHLHFSRQTTAPVWGVSIPTDFVEAPCLMGCTNIYQSQNVEIAPAPVLSALLPSSGQSGTSVQVKLTGTNFLYGSTVAVGGTGITVSNVTLASSTELNATFTIAAGASAGARGVTVTTVSGTSNSLSFTVNASTQITLASQPSGLSVSADGGSACTTPCSFQWAPGSSHTIATTATQSGGTGTQYLWSVWSDGGAISHSIVVPSSAATYTATFTTQYFLTTQASPSAGGSISPAGAWYNSGASVSVSASANAGYTFAGFTGALAGTATPQNLAMNAPATVTANFSLNGGGSAPWYGTAGAWAFRKRLTVDRTKVSGTTALADFPVLVSFTDADLRSTANGGKVGKANGGDILFAASDGVTKLNHEIESYDAATGRLVAWVRVSSLSPSADTVIYAYYGNSAAADQQNAAGVWETNFKGVWHLGATSGTAVSDSTSNANHGTKTSSSAPAPATGQIGGGQAFAGDATGVTVPDSNSLDAGTAVTISAWVKANSWPNDYGDAILNKEGNYALRSGENAASQFDVLWWNTSGRIRISRTTPPSPGVWHYVVGQANAGDAYRLYVDGVQVGAAPANWAPDTRNLTGVLTIGTSLDPGFNGSIDEARVATVVRSADWIVTEYRNQNSPGTFYSVGLEENSGSPTQVAAPVFTPGGGTYSGTQNVTIASGTAGASIRYTTDGTAPTSTTGTLYSGPVAVSSTATLRAMAYLSGMTDSAVTAATYTITFPVSITVTSSPAGRALTVDGTACTAPCALQWTAGTSHTVATTSPQAGATGTQYVFGSWSDGGAISHSVTAPSTATTYTASFTTQYFLTTQTSPAAGGTISPASAWYDSGTSVPVSATANSGYTFAGFTGGLTGTTTPQNLPMNAPATVTATFTAISGITVTSSPAGRALTVDGTACTAPCTFQWTAGTSHTIATASPQAGATGTQYVFSSWSDGGAISHSVTAPAAATTYTASFTTQYFLTTQASPSAGGTISPAGAWYNSGTSVAVSAAANAGYTFSGFSGGLTGTTTPQNVTMNAPVTVTATFTPVSGITIASSPAGRALTVDGAACTAPCTYQWTAGSSHNVATTSLQAGAAGTQYVFSNWSDGGAISHSITAPAAAATYTATFTTQYFLTTQATPSAGGSISPASAWYNSGTSVPVSATANSGYTFSGFSGGLTGTTTPQTLVMNAAATVTANFTVNGGGGVPWYTTGGTWTHRKRVTVDRTKVSGAASLTNFPMVVSVTDPDLRSTANGGSVGKTNGGDILFTASDGTTKLNHEVESYDPATGQLVAWVRIPSLSPTADTVIYTYYGNASAANQQNSTAVWDTNYRGVWHLGATSGTAISDSTTNANHGTKTSAAAPAAGAGQIGGGQVFNGDATGVTVPDSNSLDATTAVTISAWVKANSWPNDYGDAIINKEGNYALRSGENAASQLDMLWWNTSGRIRISRTTPPAAGVWHYVVGQANSNDAYRLYVDGVQVGVAPANWAPDSRNLTGVLTIGTSIYDPGFNGSVDEVRVSNSVRSADWIVTEYRNQNSPGTFYTIGVQE